MRRGVRDCSWHYRYEAFIKSGFPFLIAVGCIDVIMGKNCFPYCCSWSYRYETIIRSCFRFTIAVMDETRSKSCFPFKMQLTLYIWNIIKSCFPIMIAVVIDVTMSKSCFPSIVAVDAIDITLLSRGFPSMVEVGVIDVTIGQELFTLIGAPDSIDMKPQELFPAHHCSWYYRCDNWQELCPLYDCSCFTDEAMSKNWFTLEIIR